MLNEILLINVVMIVSKYLWIFRTKYQIALDEAKKIG